MYFEVFLVGLLAGISPGPDFVVVMKNSLSGGRGSGRGAALGIATALIIHVSYTVLGFAVLLQHYPGLFHGIQLAGAAYLIFLGLQALRSRPAPPQTAPLAETAAGTAPSGISRGFRDGFLCNLLNPKAPLFYLSIFAQFLTPATPGWVRWIYGLETVVAVGGWFLFLATVASSEHFRKVYVKSRHWFDRALGLVLLYLAVRIIWSAIK